MGRRGFAVGVLLLLVGAGCGSGARQGRTAPQDGGALPDGGQPPPEDGGTTPDAGATGTDAGARDAGATDAGADGGVHAFRCAPLPHPPVQSCDALPTLGGPRRTAPVTADAGCQVTYSSEDRASLLWPSTGEGWLWVLSPDLLVGPDQFSAWVQSLTQVDVDGGVRQIRGREYWGSSSPLLPLARDWVWLDVPYNVHTGLAGSFSVHRMRPELDLANQLYLAEEQIGAGGAPFLTRTVPSGGLVALHADSPGDCTGHYSPWSPNGSMAPLFVTPDGEVTQAASFACLNWEQNVVAQVNGCGETLVYLHPADGAEAQLWRVFPDGRAARVSVPLAGEVVQIVPMTDGRFAVAGARQWFGVLGDDDTWQPTPNWLVPRLGQDLRPLPSGSGYWHVTTESVEARYTFVDAGYTFPCTTWIEELGADGTSCHSYEVGSVHPGECTSRPLVRGVDGTVAQLSPTCEVLIWPHARP